MSRHEVTDLLNALQKGDENAIDLLFPRVYRELRHVAHRQLNREREGHTLNTTALVHEAYLKMAKRPPEIEWASRRHFYSIAARAMRQILVDYARSRNRRKRGRGEPLLTFDENLQLPTVRADELVALDEALHILAGISDRQANVVECRFFAGLSIRDTSSVLNISVATVNRDWTTARMWLKREISRILNR